MIIMQGENVEGYSRGDILQSIQIANVLNMY